MSSDPRSTALLDQAGAAWHESEAHMHAVADLMGGTAAKRKLGPSTLGLIEAMMRRGCAGGITLCPHLSYSHPAPAAWCAWAPGRLRCQPCLVTAMQRIRGTTEDRRCDSCSTVVPKPDQIYAAQVVVPPIPDVILFQRTGTLGPLPPVTMHAGLCTPCKQQDGEW